MRTLITALALIATIATASAQGTGPLTQTIKFHGPDGEIIGTATISRNSIYFRDAKGELTGTTVVNPDGSRTMYDPSGKVTGTATVSGTTVTTRDANGNITGTSAMENGKMVARDPSGNIISTGTTQRP
jgi:YD repeat-containing protein